MVSVRGAVIASAVFGTIVIVAVANMPARQQPHSAPVKPAEPSAAEMLAQQQQADAAARLIRAWGYDCRTVDRVMPDAWTTAFSHESWTVACNHYRYLFTIENHGGRWSVKAS